MKIFQLFFIIVGVLIINCSEKEKEDGKFIFEDPSNMVSFHKDVVINKGLYGKDIHARTLEVKEHIEVNQSITAATIHVNTITANKLQVQEISSTSGSIYLANKVILGDEGVDPSSIEIPALGGPIKQWVMLFHDDFEEEKSFKGWNTDQKTKCGGETQHFLGGPCATSKKKNQTDIPSHHHLRINGNVHFLGKWEGDAVYLKIDNKLVWTYSVNAIAVKHNMKICGGSFDEAMFGIALDVTVSHDQNKVNIEFGSTLDEDACVASYGIDDIMLYIK